MFEKFTERARKVMSLARQEAQRLNSEFIATEHILLGIIQEGGGVAAKVLKNLNVDLKRIRQEIEKLVTPSSSPTVVLGQLPFSLRAKRVIELAGESASQLGHDVIGTEHLLLGLLQEHDGVAAQVLMNLGLKLDEVRDMVLEILGADLAAKAPRGAPRSSPEASALSHVVDRPPVTDRLLEFLLRGRSVALVGARGVGKTSLALGIVRWKLSRLQMQPLDPLSVVPVGKTPCVWFLSEADLLSGAREETIARLEGRQLLLEFLPEGFEAFARRFPAFVQGLLPFKVDAPGDAEGWALLIAARTRLLEDTGFTLSDALLRDADRLVRERIRRPMAPWSTMRVLRAAVPYARTPPEIRRLDAEIAELNHQKDQAIEFQRYEDAAELRERRKALERERDAAVARARGSPPTTELTFEAIRAAIDEMANA